MGTRSFAQGRQGAHFSWEVFESEPGYCWFGQEFCVNGSTTISQRATINTRDMGTLRDSPMDLTVTVECSHLNNSPFLESSKNKLFLRLGSLTPDADADIENVTIILLDPSNDYFGSVYNIKYFSYNLPNMTWQAPEFLLKNLDSPFATGDNITASSTLTLILNIFHNVQARYPNDDPFLSTQHTPNDLGLYDPRQPVASLVCRERIQLTLNDQRPPYNKFNATGTVPNVSEMWWQYIGLQPKSKEWADLELDFKLLIGFPFTPSVMGATLTGLGGQTLRAQSTLVMPGLQYEFPQNLTTRREFTRWFDETTREGR